MALKVTEPIPPSMHWESVSSLVGSLRARSLVAYPESETDCRDAILFCRRNGLSMCARGGGYSYGDVILNDQNVLLDTSRMNRIRQFDRERGRMVVEPGVPLIDIIRRILPLRLALGAVPSESTITVAGAVSTNVNGKDGWRLGQFGDQVHSLKLMLASGEVVNVGRRENTELFRAVIGGMGLLGVIVEVTLQFQKIPSPFLEIRRTPVHDMVELLQHLDQIEASNDFAVVWVDTCARGDQLGRAVIHATSWVDSESTAEELEVQLAASFHRLEKRLRQARLLSPLTGFVVATMMQAQKISVCLFNTLYFLYSRLRRRLHTADNVESFLRYNFDASFVIPSAAAVCGPRGYTIQIIVPRSSARSAIIETVRLCQASPCLPAKLVMRLHRRDDYLISFSEDGYSLNLELHPKKRHVERMNRFVEELVELVIAHDGKVHLAKDHVLNGDQFRRLFPKYVEFLAIKERFDPDELFQSDLYRRLFRNEAAWQAKPVAATV